MEATRVLIVEDDASLRAALIRGLAKQGLDASAVADGGSALERLDRPDGRFDVVILDIGLPDSDGRDVCQAMRTRGVTAPVLFLTARGDVGDLVSGFASGGDDYLSKPFHFAESLARLNALARRSERSATPAITGLHLDPRTHAVVNQGVSIRLTPTEYRILAVLGPRPTGSFGGVAHGRGLAGGSDRPGEHVGPVRRPDQAQVQPTPVEAEPRHRARRGVSARMTRAVRRPREPWSLSSRAALAGVAVLGLWVVVLTVAVNVAVAAAMQHQADNVLRTRAQAAATTVQVAPDGTVQVQDTANDAAIDVGTWIFGGRTILESPAGSSALDDTAAGLIGDQERFTQTGGPSGSRWYVELSSTAAHRSPPWSPRCHWLRTGPRSSSCWSGHDPRRPAPRCCLVRAARASVVRCAPSPR